MLNTQDAFKNIEANLKLKLPEVKAGKEKGQPLAIVGGGPSLLDHYQKLKHFKKIVALNNTHDWLIDRDIKPYAMVMTDARAENIAFVQHPKKYVKYYLSSKCHPDVFKKLKKQTVTLFHEYEGLGSTVIHGGSTVGLRAISLFHCLGYRDFYLFGFDSCYGNQGHHAYKQALNDQDNIQDFTINGKTFQCADWMIEQAIDFDKFLTKFSHLFDISIVGEGLLTEVLRGNH